jgi:hypothetical protein
LLVEAVLHHQTLDERVELLRAQVEGGEVVELDALASAEVNLSSVTFLLIEEDLVVALGKEVDGPAALNPLDLNPDPPFQKVDIQLRTLQIEAIFACLSDLPALGTRSGRWPDVVGKDCVGKVMPKETSGYTLGLAESAHWSPGWCWRGP